VPELGSLGSVRGALSNECPYRERDQGFGGSACVAVVAPAGRPDGGFHRERSGCGGVGSNPATHSTNRLALSIASRAISAEMCEPGPVR
jgi:hypothetical protein